MNLTATERDNVVRTSPSFPTPNHFALISSLAQPSVLHTNDKKVRFQISVAPEVIWRSSQYKNYHRRQRDPMTYPTLVTMPIASEYQVATKSGLSSRQWKA